ncbi:MAG: M20 family metallopeptidase [Desulfurococcaceae archaeon]|uniref:ArgE/DapE family deacylase n=1 Tax=Staphylothermus marinus TaxID=2280 RepID=A0A7C4D9W3_STAMA
MLKPSPWIYELAEEVLIESIKYPTVLGENYYEIVNYYAEILSKHGVYVNIHRVPDEYVKQTLPREYNPDKPRYILIARTGSGEKILQFNGHYDVVYPGEGWKITEPFKPKKIDNKIYGRGSTDMKGGIASIIGTLVYLSTISDLNIVVEAVIVPDEEIGGLTGTGYLVEYMNSRPNWVVIAEPSGLENIWIGHKGLVWGFIKTKGIQVHGSIPWLGDNAFEKMVKVADYFIKNYLPYLKNKKSSYIYDAPGGEYPSATLGGKLIAPGSINIVPGVSGFSIDRRLIIEENVDEVVGEINNFVERASRELGFEVEFSIVEKMNPAFTNPESKLVKTLSKVVYKQIGVEPVKTVCVGGLDMRYYSYRGIETVAYGPGVPYMSHQVDEYIVLDNVFKVIDIYVDLAYNLSLETV